MNVGKSTIQRRIAEKSILSHTNAIKPLLSLKCKEHKLQFSLSELDPLTLKFRGMHNVIHIDEMWFYLTQPTVRYLLAPGEPHPHRTTQHKSHIPKLSFLCAVSRPFIDSNGVVLFDGKIGMFPYVKKVKAKNKSKNRSAWTLVTTTIPSIDYDQTLQMMVTKVLPTIKRKWPPFLSKNIVLHQDNARTHIKNNDLVFRAAACSDGFDIQFKCQPPQSPNMNILDLGFFNSIQSLEHETAANNLNELLDAVYKAFDAEKSETINKVFLTYQSVLLEMKKVRGGNNYKMPHMGKDALIRASLLPEVLTTDNEVVMECIQHLREVKATEMIGPLMRAMSLHALASTST